MVKCNVRTKRQTCSKGPKTRHKCKGNHAYETPHECKHCGGRFA